MKETVASTLDCFIFHLHLCNAFTISCLFSGFFLCIQSPCLSLIFSPSALPGVFLSCSPLIVLFPLPARCLCNVHSHRGGQPVDRKLIRSRGIPHGNISYSEVLLCVCVICSRASVTRRRKPPTWRLTSGGSTDCVTWWRLKSAWWVAIVGTPGAPVFCF